jgi:RNA 3'-terminal phosphate cyclase-like protein
VRRVRGVAYATRVSPHMGNRVIEGARSVLGDFSPDIYISVEHTKGAESGLYVFLFTHCLL